MARKIRVIDNTPMKLNNVYVSSQISGEYVKKQRDYKELGFDTLQSDLEYLGTVIKDVYSGWQKDSTMKTIKSAIQSMNNRLTTLQEYRKEYGITGDEEDEKGFNELVEGYKQTLDGWDELTTEYGQYKSSKEYYDAVEEGKKAEREEKAMATADLSKVRIQIDKLKSDLDTAKKMHKEWEIPVVGMFDEATTKKTGRITYYNNPQAQKLAEQARDNTIKQEFGYSIEELEEKYSKEEAKYKRAEFLQSALKLVKDARSDVNYDAWSQEGMSYSPKEFGDTYVVSGNSSASVVKNDKYRNAAIAINEYFTGEKTDFDLWDYSDEVGTERYRLMKEDEFKDFAYWLKYDKENGTRKAYDYIDSLEETLNDREALTIAQEYEDSSTLSKVLYGFGAGLDQFASGIRNAFNTTDDYIPTTSTQFAAQKIRRGMYDEWADLPDWMGGGSLGQAMFDTAQSIGNMAPSMAAGAVSNFVVPGSGVYVYSALMGTSAHGNAYQEMLNQGYSKTQSRTYATLVGVSEATLNYFLNGVMGGKATEKAIETAIKGIDKGFLRFAVRWGMSGASEIPEEFAQSVLDPIFQNIAVGYELNDMSEFDWSQAVYEGLLGGFSGLLLGGGRSATSTISEQGAWRNAGKNIRTNNIIPNVLDIAKLTPQDSDAYQTYTRYVMKGINADNITDTQIGRLYGEINTFFKNKVENDSKARLLELGIDQKMAKELAPVAAKAVFGEELNSAEHLTLNESEIATQVVKELSADRSNTVWKDAIKNNNVNFYDYANKNNILHSENNDNIINTIDDDYVDANANTKDIIKTRQADVLSNISGESHRKNYKLYENKALNESELTAVLNYKSSESYKINDTLRNFENLSDVDVEFVKNMDSALSKMPTYQGTVYRNIAFDWFGGQEAYDAFLSEHKVGYVVDYSAFTSASIKEDGYLVDGRFAVSMVLESRSAKNVDGYGNNFESEVIFPRNSVFVVNDVKYNDIGQPIIYMTEVIKNDEGKHGQFYSKERSEAVQSLSKSQPRYSDLQDISDDNTTRRLDRKNYLQGVSGKERRLNYNDNNIKEGEKYAEYYQRTMGSLGREIEKDDTGGTSGKTKENAETTREVGIAFQRRAKETYGDAGRLGFHLNTTVAYKVTDYIDDKSPAGVAFNILKSKGYNVVYCDGAFEVNNGTITRDVYEAITLFDGTIYISSEAKLDGKGIALHESVHVWQYNNRKKYVEYEDVLCEEIDCTSECYEKLAEEINGNHYSGKYDIEDIGSFKYIVKELAAYINQYVNTNIEYARNRFGAAFRSFENVVNAVYTMNNSLGFGDMIIQATSSDEVAFLNSSEKQADVMDEDEFIRGLRGEDRNSATNYKYDNITKKEYDKFFFKKPIKVSKKDWAKVDSARTQKYSRYAEEDIPDIDFFRIAEYNQIDTAYKYCVRNYDKYSFEIVSKNKIKPEAFQKRLEEKYYDESTCTKDDATRVRFGSNRNGSIGIGYGRAIQRNDTMAGLGEKSNQRRSDDKNNSDSRRRIDNSNINEATSSDEVAFSMPIGSRKNKFKNQVIELSKNNELSKRIGDLRGSEKYKVIQQYILDVLSGEQIVLSDGKVAIVDKSDALHIANKAANKKTAQISNIKEIVQKAVLVAEEQSVKGRKFDYFYYYEAVVKYDNEIFNVYLDVGRARNDGTYHIYDITNKIRDTANRINGLERPKPNEGYALTNGISNNSIIETNQHVNNNSVTNTDMFDEKKENADTTHETGIDFSQEYVDNLLEDFGITSLEDYIHVQKRVMETLEGEGFFTDKENRCTKVVNDASGMVVEINKKGIKETFDFYNYICWSYEKKIAKLATIRKLSEIIKYGELIKDNVENAHEGTAVNKKFAYIRHTISVDGKAITLQIDIKKSPEKNKFWVHKIIKIDGVNNIPNNVDAIELGQTIVGTKDVNANNIPNNVKAIELGYTEVSVDKVSVSQESKNVNDDSSTNTDMFAGVAELNSQEIAYIEDMCNNLGRKVVFEDLRDMVYKGEIISPDGYIDAYDVIHINTYAENPLGFVFKHELTHFCEKSGKYQSFVKAVERSSLYDKWLKEKTGKEYLWEAEEALRQMVYESSNGKFQSVDDARINKEIIAYFVGDMLFTDNGSGMAAIVSEADTKHHNALVQFILDFISFIKKKLSGQKFMTMQLSLLEDSFNRALSDATNVERSGDYIRDGDKFYIGSKSVDKYGYNQDNISKANKHGDFLNEFYEALNRSEWAQFYNAISKEGYLATTQIGTIAPIVIKDKLVIANRIYTSKNTHDYIVRDVFKIVDFNNDNYSLILIKEAIEKGEIYYDRETINSILSKFLKRALSTELLARYNGNSKQYVVGATERKYDTNTFEIYRDSKEGVGREGFSLRDKSSVQGIDGLLSNREIENKATSSDEVAFSMPIGSRKNKFKNQVIELSKDNELSKRIFGLYSTEKYKEIQKYIFDILGGQEIILSDGKKAIVDKSDARHISQNAGSKKAAQISAIKEIIEKAILIAEEKSLKGRKFEYFYYYGVSVKYEGEIFNIYLNVGRARNDGTYHLYDITQKLRDTAHRIIDVGRPLPNEGYALKSNISNDSIIESNKYVNNDSSTNTDMFAGVAELNSQEIAYIEDICNNLGRKVVFEDLRNVLYKGDIVSPDGYVKDGVLHVNTYAINPLGFVLKHELTHFCEKSSKYQSFVKAVERSSLYKEWIKSKTGKEYLWDAEEAYKQMVYKANSKFKSVDDPRINKEIIADFVGDMLFTDNGSGMAAIISEADTKHHNALVQFILDFISFIKKKLSGQKFMTMQLSLLEDSFNRALSDATNAERSGYYIRDGEVRYSFSGSKNGEKLYNTSDKLKPTSEREWSVFNRQFSNETSHLKNGEHKNIIIYTESDVYFVDANGYMTGRIDYKMHIDDNQKNIDKMIKEYLNGTIAIREIFNPSIKGARSELERSDRNIAGTEGRDGQSQNIDLDARQSASDDVGYNWENYGYDTWEELIDAISSGLIIMDENGDIISLNENVENKTASREKAVFSMPKNNDISRENTNANNDSSKINDIIDEENNKRNGVYSYDDGVSFCFALCNNTEQINKAEQLESEGKNCEQIFRESGLIKDGYGKWKYELNTKRIQFFPNGNAKTAWHRPNKKLVQSGVSTIGTLRDYIKSKDLFDVYPELKELTVVVRYSAMDTVRFYIDAYEDKPKIAINKKLCEEYDSREDRILKPALLREVQRAIQYYNGEGKGKSLEVWQLLEQEGKTPYSKTLRRRLTAEEAYKYYANNYEALMVEKRAKERQVLTKDYRINYADMNDTALYSMNYDRNKAVIFDENGDAVVVKDYENPGMDDTDIDEINLENEIQDDTNLDIGDELESTMLDEDEKPIYQNGIENIHNSHKLKSLLITAGQVAYDDKNKDVKITAGIDAAISNVAENPKEFAQKFGVDKTLELSQQKLSRFDTVGRVLSDYVARELHDTFLKDENGRVIPLFTLKAQGVGGFKHSKLGLVAGTLESVCQQYSELNEETYVNRRATIQEIFVKMKNPLVLDYIPYELSINGLHDLTDRGILTFEEYVRYVNSKKNYTGYYSVVPQKVRERIKSAGYDGIIFLNDTTDKGSMSVVVLDESQIITVAENGVLVEGNGISEMEITSSEINDTSSSVDNSIKIGMIATERKYLHKHKRLIPSEKIAAGSSDYFEKGVLSSADAYDELKETIKSRLNTNLSGKDTVGRILSEDIVGEFNQTAFKDKDGNLLSFYVYDTHNINLKKATNLRTQFTTLNSAIDSLRLNKKTAPQARHGAIQEFYINSVNSIIIKSDEYDLAKIAEQIFNDGKITEAEYNRMCLFERSMRTLVERSLKRNNYDSVILVKSNGEKAVIPLDESQILPVAKNGILESGSKNIKSDKADRDIKILNLESVVIEENCRSAIKVDAIDDILQNDNSNTAKLKLLTKVVMCSNNSEIDYDIQYLAGSSGALERGDINVWRARNVVKTLVNRDDSNISIADTDTAGRALSDRKKELLKGCKFVDDYGRPYSLFAVNRYGDNRLLRGQSGFRLGTLDAAYEKYVADKEKFYKNNNIVRYEEYYTTVKKPYFLMFDPEDATPSVMAKQLLNEGILTQVEYQQILVRDINQKTEHSNLAKKRLFKILKKRGFDSLAFMSDRYDAGSIGLIIFDGSKLIPVAVDGLPVENSDRTLADSNEPVFVPENDDEKFVEKSDKKKIDSLADKRYNKKKYLNRRPSYGKDQILAVWNYAKSLGRGKVTDPTGKEIIWDISKSRNGQWDMGHIPGQKYSIMHKKYLNDEITEEEFVSWYRDPSNYRPELPSTNRSHKYE